MTDEPTSEPTPNIRPEGRIARTWELHRGLGCDVPEPVDNAPTLTLMAELGEIGVLAVRCSKQDPMVLGFFPPDDGAEVDGGWWAEYLDVSEVAGATSYGGFDDYRLVGDAVEVDWWASETSGAVERTGTSLVRWEEDGLAVSDG